MKIWSVSMKRSLSIEVREYGGSLTSLTYASIMTPENSETRGPIVNDRPLNIFNNSPLSGAETSLSFCMNVTLLL